MTADALDVIDILEDLEALEALDVIDLLEVLEALDMALELGELRVEFVDGGSTEEPDGVVLVECFEFELDDTEERGDVDWPW